MTFHSQEIDLLNLSIKEQQAQDHIKNDRIDEAIAIYQSLQSGSARIIILIGKLFADKKGDYELAIDYFVRALSIQEKNEEDTSDTLHEIGMAYQNLREYEFSLYHHLRALQIRQLNSLNSRKKIATSLFGIANAHWSLKNLSEALHYAQQALTLNQSIQTDNQPNIAASLAILANIYHSTGDDISALELAQRALTLLETCVSSDSSELVPLLNNIGTIQISITLFNDALLTFIRVLHICERTLPEGHPKRTTIENNIRLVRTMQENYYVESYSHLWQILTKFLLF